MRQGEFIKLFIEAEQLTTGEAKVVGLHNAARQQRIGALQITIGHEYDFGFVVDALPFLGREPS